MSSRPSAPSDRPPISGIRHLPPLGDMGAVLAGGLVGSAARAGIGIWLPATTGGCPTATLLVNLAGSLLIGTYLTRREQSVTMRRSLQFWAFGALGSFTTFSAFSLEVVRLIEQDRVMVAGGYVAASTIGGLVAALIGQRVARAR